MKCLLLLLASAAPILAQSYDLVVYGGTAGGVITAVSGARKGLKTVLLEPRQHIGGMVSGGLARTDVGKREVIGGYALEFYWRAGNAYEMSRYGQEIAWLHEPHVAEDIFRQMLKEAGVTVLLDQRLREKNGVRKSAARIQSITTENGDSVHRAHLRRQHLRRRPHGAGRRHLHLGPRKLGAVRRIARRRARRDAQAPVHGRSLARTRPANCFPRFPPRPRRTRRRRPQGAGLQLPHDPFARSGQPGALPQARGLRPGALRTVRPPARRHAEEAGTPVAHGRSPLRIPIPNHKADINNNGAFSTDYIGKSWDYPNATYARRAEIWRDHEDYIERLFYFLAHDPRVPPSLSKEMNHWGLAKDEFVDTDTGPTSSTSAKRAAWSASTS